MQLYGGEWWREKMKSCDVHRLAVSFWGGVTFAGLGVSLVVFAPTLLDIAHQLNVGVGLLSVIFFVRAIGGVLGTVGSGIFLDHFPRLKYVLLCCVLACGVAANSVVPVSGNIVILGVVMLVIGITLGGLDNGVQVILMRLWSDKSGPCLQFLHASVAVGAFIAPLIAKPFIRDISDGEDDYNTSLVFNISCSSGNDSDCYDSIPVACVCPDTVAAACNETHSGVVNIYYSVAGNNCMTIPDIMDETFASDVGWVYWISAMILVPPLLAFLYFAVRCTFSSKRTLTVTIEEGEIRDKIDCDNTKDVDLKQAIKTYKTPALVILFFFMMFYVGLELSFGTLVFTYAVEGKLKFNEQNAALLTAVFWGMFAFARCFSIIPSILKVRAFIIMSLNVCGSAIAVLIFVILPHNHVAIWIVAALLGASFASNYPTTMTWLSQHIPISGKATAVLITGGNLGNILIPSGVAALIGNVTPDAFIYSILVLIILSTVLMALLLTVTALYQRRHKLSNKSVKYCKLDEAIDLS